MPWRDVQEEMEEGKNKFALFFTFSIPYTSLSFFSLFSLPFFSPLLPLPLAWSPFISSFQIFLQLSDFHRLSDTLNSITATYGASSPASLHVVLFLPQYPATVQ